MRICRAWKRYISLYRKVFAGQEDWEKRNGVAVYKAGRNGKNL